MYSLTSTSEREPFLYAILQHQECAQRRLAHVYASSHGRLVQMHTADNLRRTAKKHHRLSCRSTVSSYLRFLLEAVCTATLTHALELSHVRQCMSNSELQNLIFMCAVLNTRTDAMHASRCLDDLVFFPESKRQSGIRSDLCLPDNPSDTSPNDIYKTSNS